MSSSLPGAGSWSSSAGQRPTVLVFEDLHWADDAMRAFLDDLEVNAADVPLVVLRTSRPGLPASHTTPARPARAVQIELQPLSDEAASDLLLTLLETSDIAPSLLDAVVERGGGNPLFAEEFVRLLRDRDLLVGTDGAIGLRPGAELPMPESIHSLLAARLDALPPPWKAILGEAAVIGKVFWAGAVAAMGERPLGEVIAALDGLAERELVRVQPRSSIADEREYTFWHVLARDVAYAGIPRARRSSSHLAAARWIDRMAGDRVEDVAQILAHHYVTAMDLATAVGDVALTEELRPEAIRFLLLAGQRTLGLDTTVALGLIERALALVPSGHPQRAPALAAYGAAMSQDGRYVEAQAALVEAIELFRRAARCWRRPRRWASSPPCPTS